MHTFRSMKKNIVLRRIPTDRLCSIIFKTDSDPRQPTHLNSFLAANKMYESTCSVVIFNENSKKKNNKQIFGIPHYNSSSNVSNYGLASPKKESCVGKRYTPHGIDSVFSSHLFIIIESHLNYDVKHHTRMGINNIIIRLMSSVSPEPDTAFEIIFVIFFFRLTKSFFLFIENHISLPTMLRGNGMLSFC